MNERKCIHPVAFHVLHETRRRSKVEKEWEDMGQPYLTDRTKAILEAAERTLKLCNKCDVKDKEWCDEQDDESAFHWCEVSALRRASRTND